MAASLATQIGYRITQINRMNQKELLDYIAKQQLNLKNTPRMQLSRLMARIKESIKSIDGIDDIALAAGQIIPGVGGPISAVIILTIALPFVFLGVSGMIEENEEKNKAYKEFKISYAESANELRRIALIESDEVRRFINEYVLEEKELKEDKKQKIIEESNSLRKEQKEQVDLSASIVHYLNLKSKSNLVEQERKFTVFGAIGMGAMFSALLPGIVRSSMEIIKPSLIVAISGIEIASDSLFIFGQISLVIYAINKVVVGRKELKKISQKEESISRTNVFDTKTRMHLNSILSRQRGFVKGINIIYGSITIVGQVMMFLGTSLGLFFGFGFVVTGPFLLLGAPLCIVPAIFRVTAEIKEKKFQGIYDYKKDDVLSNVNNFFENNNYEGTGARDKLEKDFVVTSNRLVVVKVISLMHMIINDKLNKFKGLDKDDKFNKLKGRFDIDFDQDAEEEAIGMKRTSLEGVLVKKVYCCIKKNEDKIKKIFDMKASEANTVLTDNILKCLRTDLMDSDKFCFDLLEESIVIANEKNLLESYGMKMDTANVLDGSRLPVNKVIKVVKNSLKGIRFKQFELLIDAIQNDDIDRRLKNARHNKESLGLGSIRS